MLNFNEGSNCLLRFSGGEVILTQQACARQKKQTKPQRARQKKERAAHGEHQAGAPLLRHEHKSTRKSCPLTAYYLLCMHDGLKIVFSVFTSIPLLATTLIVFDCRWMHAYDRRSL